MKRLISTIAMAILGWLILYSTALVPNGDPLLVAAGMCFGYVATKVAVITVDAWRAI